MDNASQSHAIMLLTVALEKSDASAAKPLSVKEWGRFAEWLNQKGIDPSDLFKSDIKALLTGWADSKITPARIESLLSRGGALGLSLEKWERAGLWVMTRADHDYPERLKRHLRLESPPVLFGCGNKALLNSGGIAVIGSRNAAPDDLTFAEQIAMTTAQQGNSIISGGARGIDQSAMLGALHNEGTAIGVMADNLLAATTTAQYRPYLLSKDLVLITPFNPEAGFNVGNAMARNRYIYCLADAAIVVCSAQNKGGTWQGATENLKHGWIPLWAKPTTDKTSGNPALIAQGAHPLPANLDEFPHLSENTPHPAPPPTTPTESRHQYSLLGDSG